MPKRQFLPSLVVVTFLGLAHLPPSAKAQPAFDASAHPTTLEPRADRFVIRLSREASRAAYATRRPDARFRARMGLASLDALLSSWPGCRLEAEFRNDAPPPPGSKAADFAGFYIVHLPPGVTLDDGLRRFRQLPEVIEAHPIRLTSVASVPNDSLWSLAYHLYQPSRRDIHALEAWDLTRGDTSQVVAVIDTGLLPYHPDISGTVAGSSGQIWTNWTEAGGAAGVDDDLNGFVDDVHGWDFVDHVDGTDAVPGEDWEDEDNDPNDFLGHGTCVAGFIGALSDNQIGVTGTAWRVRIMPLRVVWSSPRQQAGIVDMTYLARAIRYATLMKATVINVSLSSDAETDLELAVGAALDSNVVLVVAAGNNNSPNTIAVNFADAIVVGATDRDDVVPVWSSRSRYVDLAAPGFLLPSTIRKQSGSDSLSLRQPSYVPDASGTSFSAPIVSGAVTLVQAHRGAHGLPPLPPSTMNLLLRRTADDIRSQNPDETEIGEGRLNAARAVGLGSRIRARRLEHGTKGPGMVMSTNAGDSRLVYVDEGDRVVFLDSNDLETARPPLPLVSIPVGGLASADLGGQRGLGIFVPLLFRMEGLGAGGAPLPGWPVPAPGGLVGNPALGDLDGDGSLEIVCAGHQGTIWAWHANGVVVNGFPVSKDPTQGPFGPIALADLDGVPGVEIIAALPNGIVHALRMDGQEIAGWPVDLLDPSPSAPVVASMAGDPVVVIAGIRLLHVLRRDGGERSRTPLSWTEGSVDPALGDLNLDGVDEVVIVTPRSIEAYTLEGIPLPGWPVRWLARTDVGPPVIVPFAAADTQAVLAAIGSELRSWSGSGADLAEFPPLTQGHPFGAVTIPLPGSGLRLAVGTAEDRHLYAYDIPRVSLGSRAWPTPRGNLARTGSRLYEPPAGIGDVRPPAVVSDLKATPFGGPGSTLLTWSAPLDEGPAGKPIQYEVRSAGSIDDLLLRFSTARLHATGIPRSPGSPESLFANSLPAHDEYFAMRSRDASGNWSAVTTPVHRSGRDPLMGAAPFALATARNPSPAPISFLWRASTGLDRSIRIYDIGGRLVRSLSLGEAPGGVTHWDGDDANGRALPAGVYVAALTHDGTKVSRRFVLLR